LVHMAEEPVGSDDFLDESKPMSNPALKFDHVHIISQDPEASANWYATITSNTMARGAPQIFVDLGGMTILIRGQRPDEAPVAARPIRQFADFFSHDARGIDHFGFIYQGDLTAFCEELRVKGVSFPVALKKGVGGRLLCYVAAPDGVSIELMEC
jgi:catechol 2,3-dioxygenase-like lactoylglutathione lyase family enzyme